MEPQPQISILKVWIKMRIPPPPKYSRWFNLCSHCNSFKHIFGNLTNIFYLFQALLWYNQSRHPDLRHIIVKIQFFQGLWHEERQKKRITASNFGAILKRKKDTTDKFLRNSFLKKDFTSSATSYGKANEAVAKQMYIKRTGSHLHEVFSDSGQSK